jgi:FkbM family methyltransferase
MIEKIFKDLLDYFILAKNKTHSLSNQDLFVLYFTNYAEKGFFVEIGAGDGVKISNTYLLEKLNWQGIIVDPVNYNSENIKLRKCIKDNRAVYSKSGLKLPFVVVNSIADQAFQAENFSGLLDHFRDDFKTLPNKIINVETVSLNDLLNYYNAPNKIDYISIDTEGSEFEIISNFDLDKYDVEIFTIEHNHLNFRKDIIKLLNDRGYFRMPNDTQRGFVAGYEDWFIKNNNPVLKKLLSKF